MTLSDGRQVAYAEWGDPGGAPVIYCHGFPASRLEARLADAPARALGIRLIAPDRPGFGLSSLAPGRKLSDWPLDLIELTDELGLSRFHLIGVSGGAPYAIACAQWLGPRLEGLALVCGLGELADAQASRGMNPAAVAALDLQRRWPRFGYQVYLRAIGPLLRRYPAGVFRIIVGNGTPADRAVLADRDVKTAIIDAFAEAFRCGAAGPAQELALITQPWDIDPTRVSLGVRLWHGEADRTVPVAMGRRYGPTCVRDSSRGKATFRSSCATCMRSSPTCSSPNPTDSIARCAAPGCLARRVATEVGSVESSSVT